MPTTGNSSWGASGSFTGRREALQGWPSSTPLHLPSSLTPMGNGGHGQGLAVVPWVGPWPWGASLGFPGGLWLSQMLGDMAVGGSWEPWCWAGDGIRLLHEPTEDQRSLVEGSSLPQQSMTSTLGDLQDRLSKLSETELPDPCLHPPGSWHLMAFKQG